MCCDTQNSKIDCQNYKCEDLIGGIFMKMNDKTYDVLKWIATYLLPALGTLYFALAQIWNLPYGEQVVGSITAIDTFLGVVLGLSTSQYNKQKESDN